LAGLHREHRAMSDVFPTSVVRAPEFPSELDWLNTGGRALSLDALLGKIVLLDFWTYG
jgi:hypothetical protein